MPIGELRIKLEKIEAENQKLRTEKRELRAQLKTLNKELAAAKLLSAEQPDSTVSHEATPTSEAEVV